MQESWDVNVEDHLLLRQVDGISREMHLLLYLKKYVIIIRSQAYT